MIITREQIKAARAMLDWTQKELATRCDGVSEPTIKLIENGRVNSSAETLTIIRETFEDAGIEFLPQQGLRFRDDTVTILEKKSPNDPIFLKLLDDVYYTLQGKYGELLYSFVDNSKSAPEVIEKERMIRASGSTMRSLVRYEDTHLIYPLDEYRYMPKGYYLNNPALVYGDKFAVVIQAPDGMSVDKAIIIHNSAVADLKKKEFEIIWSMGNKPTITNAEVTYA